MRSILPYEVVKWKKGNIKEWKNNQMEDACVLRTPPEYAEIVCFIFLWTDENANKSRLVGVTHQQRNTWNAKTKTIQSLNRVLKFSYSENDLEKNALKTEAYTRKNISGLNRSLVVSFNTLSVPDQLTTTFQSLPLPLRVCSILSSTVLIFSKYLRVCTICYLCSYQIYLPFTY